MLCINDDDENDFITRKLTTEGVFIENGLQGYDCPAAWARPHHLKEIVPEVGFPRPLLLLHGGAWEISHPFYDSMGALGSCACEAPPIKKTASPTAAPTAQCAEGQYHTGGACELCPEGRSTSGLGMAQVGLEKCIICQGGRIAPEKGSSECLEW